MIRIVATLNVVILILARVVVITLKLRFDDE